MKNATINHSKIFTKVAVILTVIVVSNTAASVASEKPTFMTRNLYLGAEIQSLARSTNLAQFIAGAQDALLQIAANNFPARAEALAAEIIEKKPHIIGLQEVYNFTLNGSNGPPPFRDYLVDLLNTLEAQGANYYLVATVNNLNIALSLPPFGIVGLTDSDVILAREDVLASPVNLAGLCSRPSADGCNFQFIASASIPDVGTINFERGFVVVDALIENLPVKVFNTHLEVRNVDPNNAASPVVQAYQAAELISVINYLSYSEEAPVITLGDINSSPEDSILDLGWLQIVPPYIQLQQANVDLWTLRPGKPKGYTCCYEEDLTVAESALYERDDVIFSSEVPAHVKANVVGNDETDYQYTGYWPSDHAGVIARVEFAP